MKRAKTTLAINISKRRKELGLKQPDLAHKAGVHVNTIKDIERGLSKGHDSTKEAIAEVLGCKAWQLEIPGFFESSSTKKAPEIVEQSKSKAQLILDIQAKLGKLSIKQLDDVMDAIEAIQNPIEIDLDSAPEEREDSKV